MGNGSVWIGRGARAFARAGLGVAVVASFSLGGCNFELSLGDGPSGTPQPDAGQDAAPEAGSGSAVIGPAGGHLEISDGPLAGAALDVPPGAVEQPTAFSLRPGAEFAPPERATRIGPPVEIEPHGVTFKRLVTVRLPFDKAAMPAGWNPQRAFAVQESADKKAHRIALARSVDAEGGRLTLETRTFSTFFASGVDVESILTNEVLPRAICAGEDVKKLLTSDTRTDHSYYAEGGSIGYTITGINNQEGVDWVWDLYNFQTSTFFFLNPGFYTDILAAGGGGYTAWAWGNRPDVQSAWAGNFVSGTAGWSLPVMNAGVFASPFIGCDDTSGPDLVCFPTTEINGQSLSGVSVGMTFGLNVPLDDALFLGTNWGANMGWWWALPFANQMRELRFADMGIPVSLVSVDGAPAKYRLPNLAATDPAPTFIQFGGATELEKATNLARALLASPISMKEAIAAAAIAITAGKAKDHGQTISQYCAAPASPLVYADRFADWSSAPGPMAFFAGDYPGGATDGNPATFLGLRVSAGTGTVPSGRLWLDFTPDGKPIYLSGGPPKELTKIAATIHVTGGSMVNVGLALEVNGVKVFDRPKGASTLVDGEVVTWSAATSDVSPPFGDGKSSVKSLRIIFDYIAPAASQNRPFGVKELTME